MTDHNLKTTNFILTRNYIGIRQDTYNNTFTFLPRNITSGRNINTITITNAQNINEIQDIIRKLTCEQILETSNVTSCHITIN